MSATEAEYIAASEATMKAVWIRKFISGLEVGRVLVRSEGSRTVDIIFEAHVFGSAGITIMRHEIGIAV
nr:retrotransposon protein, putative, Ty1-copia subclass [Tanacetum cinerariifolium]